MINYSMFSYHSPIGIIGFIGIMGLFIFIWIMFIFFVCQYKQETYHSLSKILIPKLRHLLVRKRTILTYYILIRITYLCRQLFDKGFCETSQNFSWFRHFIFTIEKMVRFWSEEFAFEFHSRSVESRPQFYPKQIQLAYLNHMNICMF